MQNENENKRKNGDSAYLLSCLLDKIVRNGSLRCTFDKRVEMPDNMFSKTDELCRKICTFRKARSFCLDSFLRLIVVRHG